VQNGNEAPPGGEWKVENLAEDADTMEV